MSARRLASFVHVDGTVYGPDDDVPDEVAEKITNPNAWADKAETKTSAKKATASK